MKSASYVLIILFTITFSLTGCSNTDVSRAEALPTPIPVLPRKSVDEINLTTIKHIKPKGRAQDGSLLDQDFNELTIINELLAHGRDSIPFLINKLDDEKELNGQVMDFWNKVYTGDIALIILIDLFTKNDGFTSTIPGFGWDEFLDRGDDKNSMGETILRKYIRKHGRKTIRARWQKIWDTKKENLFWDVTERCFNLGK